MLAMLLLSRRSFPQTNATSRRFDLPGFLSLLALVVGTTVFIEAVSHADMNVFAIPSALMAIAGLLGLVASQPRVTAPLLPPVLFTIPAIRRALALVMFHGAALTAMVTLIPLFHAILRSDGALDTAWSMLALTVAFGVSGFVTGNLITLTGRTMLFPSLSLVIAGAGTIALAYWGEDLSRPLLMATYFVTGFCIGTVMAVVHTVVQQAAPEDLRGRAAGAITFFRSIGAVLGVALTSAVLFSVAPDQPGANAAALLSGSVDIAPETLEGWRTAFVAAFGTIALYLTGGWAMALRNPLRRID
jgi:MFS family permease